ncbi:MAG: TIGR00282 family metallophosphoesterase [Candidatus Faecousia sp.]|uniref:TIGR00282 family metallophosphoesterase n=1 Tax=Faecousia sp. TaxID=2952921 RepID=UPI002A85D65E|nr:TIGR00282 family metallophosphoesterase [Candidatus Faecousia sp.]
MERRILAVGDVTAGGLQFLRRRLPKLLRQREIDFCVVNGENASLVGITPEQAEAIFSAGANVITLGNHAFNRREIVPYIARTPELLRPANQPPQQPGQGWGVFETPFGDVAVVNLIGRCGMDFTPDNPFLLVERILPRLQTRLICVEIHAEATSEKQAMAWMLDGRVSAVWGTHTHVQTADEEILPNGTGRITDLGMTGPCRSILGVKPELSIKKLRGDLTGRYEPADGPCRLEGCIFTVDDRSGRCVGVERVKEHD